MSDKTKDNGCNCFFCKWYRKEITGDEAIEAGYNGHQTHYEILNDQLAKENETLKANRSKIECDICGKDISGRERYCGGCMTEKNEGYRKALEFYADEKHYEYEPKGAYPDAESGGEEVWIDLGEKARQALKGDE